MPLVLVITFGRTTCNAYINGSFAGTAAVSIPSASNPTDMTVEQRATLAIFGGKYAIEALNRVLSDTEINTIRITYFDATGLMFL